MMLLKKLYDKLVAKVNSIDTSRFVIKTKYDTDKSELENNNHNHDKYITTSEFNNLAADVFNARLAQANLVTKTDFDAKLSSFNKKILQIKQHT